MSGHTPGPWFIWRELAMQREGMEPDEIADELRYDSEHCVYAGNPQECTQSSLRGHSAHICDIDADNLDFDGNEDQCKETGLSNARLIAAAPELLEALKAVRAWDVSNLVLDIPLEVRQQMQAAIAKATGGQP